MDNNVDLGDAPGRANAGDKFLTVKGGGKTYHWGVDGQDKCPFKWPA